MIVKHMQAIRGMHDFFPKDTILFRYLENILINVLINYGYNEIRLPIIELTQLFMRAIGKVTDVVEKEMYSFNDRNGQSITLRPEGTAGCIRACIEHGIFHHSQEERFWYIGPMFRRERPQKGRFRQFHQLSIESFGSFGPGIDAELIIMTARFWKILGISEYMSLELNSIGSSLSRSLYCEELLKFLLNHKDFLDEHALRRLHSNPIRILDSKDINIQKLLRSAPVLIQYLDDDSRIHFHDLCKLLDENNISYTINPYLVRGLDYYNRTVFEWVNNTHLGAQKAVCAGGRYDGLVYELGGRNIPAIGCSIGLDRLFLLINAIDSKYLKNICLNSLDIYIAISDMSDCKLAISLSERIRDVLPILRLKVSYRIGNSRQHFRRAHKYGARVVLIMGGNMSKDYILLKDFRCGKKEEVSKNSIIEKLLIIFKVGTA